jgi:hypothetical protein
MLAYPETTTPRKPAGKIFNAHLFDEHGYLSQDEHGQIIFTNGTTYERICIEPAVVNFLSVLGEVGICECQAIRDRMRGGPARIACSRLQEVG